MSARSSTTSGQPLTVGNTVSAALRLYRDRFQSYFGLALQAYLWLLLPFLAFIPASLAITASAASGQPNWPLTLISVLAAIALGIFASAKLLATQNIITRVSYTYLIDRPETIAEARPKVMPRALRFLAAGILVSLAVFGVILLLAIGGGIAAGIFVALAGSPPSGPALIVGILLGIAFFILFLFVYLWMFARLSVPDAAIAIEPNLGAGAAVGRSWQLTKNSTDRLVRIFFVAFLVTLPVSIVVNVVNQGVQIFTTNADLAQSNPVLVVGLSLLSFVVSILGGALIAPFWQTLKATIYYDLRSRKEGLGLELTDEGL